MAKFNLGVVLVGLFIFIFGAALTPELVGLPGDALGLIVMAYGTGVRL